MQTKMSNTTYVETNTAYIVVTVIESDFNNQYKLKKSRFSIELCKQ